MGKRLPRASGVLVVPLNSTHDAATHDVGDLAAPALHCALRSHRQHSERRDQRTRDSGKTPCRTPRGSPRGNENERTSRAPWQSLGLFLFNLCVVAVVAVVRSTFVFQGRCKGREIGPLPHTLSRPGRGNGAGPAAAEGGSTGLRQIDNNRNNDNNNTIPAKRLAATVMMASCVKRAMPGDFGGAGGIGPARAR